MGTNNFADAVEAWLMALIQSKLLLAHNQDIGLYMDIAEAVGRGVGAEPRKQLVAGLPCLWRVLDAGRPLHMQSPFELDGPAPDHRTSWSFAKAAE